jgi:hypothetical protein
MFGVWESSTDLDKGIAVLSQRIQVYFEPYLDHIILRSALTQL